MIHGYGLFHLRSTALMLVEFDAKTRNCHLHAGVIQVETRIPGTVS